MLPRVKERSPVTNHLVFESIRLVGCALVKRLRVLGWDSMNSALFSAVFQLVQLSKIEYKIISANFSRTRTRGTDVPQIW